MDMSHGICETNNGSRAFELTLAALVDGLRIKNPPLNAKCFRALASMGRNALEHIRTVESDPATKPQHRQRLSALINCIEQTNAIDLPGFETVTAALIEAIQVYSPTLNRKALTAIRTFPSQIAEKLVKHALLHQKQFGSCTRLLLAVEQLGLPPGGSARMYLLNLAGHPNLQIRSLAAKILVQNIPATQALQTS